MATEIKIKNIPEGYQSIITNGKHTIIGDEPIKSTGTDLGLAPTELLLAGLGMCKAATVRHIARKKGYDVKDVNAKYSMEVGRGEGRKLLTTVKVAIHIEGNITDEQRQELMQQADRCYVHRMIEGDWNIESAVELENSQLVAATL